MKLNEVSMSKLFDLMIMGTVSIVIINALINCTCIAHPARPNYIVPIRWQQSDTIYKALKYQTFHSHHPDEMYLVLVNHFHDVHAVYSTISYQESSLCREAYRSTNNHILTEIVQKKS